MKIKIVSLLILIILLIPGLTACMLEQSPTDPMYVYLAGVGSSNVTITNYTPNITMQTATNFTGILRGYGTYFRAVNATTGQIVGTTDTQELTNKTINAAVAKGTWTNSGTWTIPAHTLSGIVTVNNQSFNGGTNDLHIDGTSGGTGLYLHLTNATATGSSITHYKDGAGSDNDWIGFTTYRGRGDDSTIKSSGTFVHYIIDATTSNYSSGFRWDSYYQNALNTQMTLSGNGSLWLDADVSALSFTDRTKYYDGDAVSELIKVKSKDGEIDHDSLPLFTQVERIYPIYDINGKTIIGYETKKERDLGATISMLTVAIKQLNARIEELENKTK